MKKALALMCCVFVSGIGFSQKYRSEKGLISIFSDAVVEDISAENTQAGSLFNAATGELVFIVPIREFKFQKSLMREHFNEKYMESEKYPKATFQGKLINFDSKGRGDQKVKAIGKLTMHGVTKDIEVPGSVEFENGKMDMKSKFVILLKDYNIKIPTIVWQNIAEQIELKIDFTYRLL